MRLAARPNQRRASVSKQDFANRLLVQGGYSRCPLPASFASQHWGRASPRLDPCACVAFPLAPPASLTRPTPTPPLARAHHVAPTGT